MEMISNGCFPGSFKKFPQAFLYGGFVVQTIRFHHFVAALTSLSKSGKLTQLHASRWRFGTRNPSMCKKNGCFSVGWLSPKSLLLIRKKRLEITRSIHVTNSLFVRVEGLEAGKTLFKHSYIWILNPYKNGLFHSPLPIYFRPWKTGVRHFFGGIIH